MNSKAEKLVCATRDRAESLFQSKQLLCSEAVLVSLNENLGGGLTEDQAIGLAAGLPVGLGASGCLCGAVSGGVLGLGLILSNGSCGRRRKATRLASKRLHDWFKCEYKSTCCRTLTKRVRDNPKEHFRQCVSFTGESAAMTARILLESRPELEKHATENYFPKSETVACGKLKWLFNIFCR